jgi:hypothetical protein
MSETNDNLTGAASDETTATTMQAEGAESSASTEQASTSTETTEKLLAGKFRNVEELERAYAEAQKLIGRKTIDSSEAARVLGGAKETATETEQTTAPTTKAEGQQVAQAVGGDELEQWFTNATKAYGQTKALTMLTQHIAQQATKATIAETLGPVNQRLAKDQETRNQERLAAAVDKLALEYPDITTHVEDMGKYLKANPRIQKEIESADTIKDKQELLELVYLKVQKTKSATASAAAKSAGAMDAKQREQMKATSVTAGAGAGAKATQGDMTPEEAYKEAMRGSLRKGSTLL